MEIVNNRYKIIERFQEEANDSKFLVLDLHKEDRLMVMQILNLEASSEKVIQYFRREFISIHTLSHPNLSKAYSFNLMKTVDGRNLSVKQYFFTYEHVAGEDIFNASLSLSMDQILEMLLQILNAVLFLHQRGFVYRNIDCKNIVVGKVEGKPQIKLTGIILDEEVEKIILRSKRIAHQFRAPETYSTGHFDAKSDIYALGVLFFYLLTRKDPENHNFLTLWDKYKANPQWMDEGIDAHYFNVIEKMTVADIERRFEDISLIIDELKVIWGKRTKSIHKKYVQRIIPKTKLIGRNECLAALSGQLSEMVFDSTFRNITFIQGEKGVGKSRLLEELSFYTKMENINVYQGNSLDPENDSLRPFTDILKQVIPSINTSSVLKYGPELIKIVPEAKEFKDIIPSSSLPETKENLRIRQRLANFLLETFETEPCVLMFDNAQWMDGDTLEVINMILKSAKPALIWVIIAFTSEEMPSNKIALEMLNQWRASGFTHEISIPRFNLEETGEFIKDLLGMGSIPDRFLERVFRESDGNPCFIRDIITTLYAQKKIYMDMNGDWCSDHDDDPTYSTLSLPLSMNEAVCKMIDTLDNPSREFLEYLSCCNEPISDNAIKSILPSLEKSKERIISRLIKLYIIDRRFDTFGIVYLIRVKSTKNYVYNGMCLEEKKKKHRILADIYRKIDIEEKRENKDELILHLTESGELNEALFYIVESARNMLKNKLNIQALALLQRGYALSLRMFSIKDGIHILMMLGNIYSDKGDNNKALDCYEKVLEYAQNLNDPITFIDSKLKIALIFFRRGELDKSNSICEEIMELSEKADYGGGFLEGAGLFLANLYFQIRYKEIPDSPIVKKCFEKYGEEKYPKQFAHMLNSLGLGYYGCHDIENAIRYLRKSIELFEKAGETVLIANPMNNLGCTYSILLGNPAKARQNFEKALEVYTNSNDEMRMAIGFFNVGETYQLEGNLFKALEYFYQAERAATESEYIGLLPQIYNGILHYHMYLGEYYKSYEYLEKGKNLLENGAKMGAAELIPIYFSWSSFYYEMGCFEEAETFINKGLDILRAQEESERPELSSLKLLIQWKRNGQIQLDELDKVFELYRNSNQVKEFRKTIHTFVEAFAEEGKIKEAHALLQQSLCLSEKEDTPRLKAEILYLEGIIKGGTQGIGSIYEAFYLNPDTEDKSFEWKVYKSVGDICYLLDNRIDAAGYYMKALEILYELASNVPLEYREMYLFSHSRNMIRERMYRIKSFFLQKLQNDVEEKRSKPANKNGNILDSFFEGVALSTEFTGDEWEVFNHKAIFEQDDTKEKIHNLINRFSWNYWSNLCLILDTGKDIVQAETGYVIRITENNDLEIIVESGRKSENLLNEYILDYVREYMEGIYAAQIFGKRVGNADIFVPENTKGVLCVPIFGGNIYQMYNSEHNWKELMGERISEYTAVNPHRVLKGFLYLATSSTLNNFSKEGFEACNKLSRLASLALENYNLKIISSCDKLTGLYTRKYFDSMIEDQLREVESQKRTLGLMMIDIDKFKSVNDRYGHQKGDEILSKVGDIIKRNIHSGDICCRYGGEEFILIAPGLDADKAAIIAERMRGAVEREHLLGANNKLTISIGIAIYPLHGKYKDELISKADQALYNAKESGRNRYFLWNDQIGRSSKRKNVLAGVITGNIVQDQRNVLTILEIVQWLNQRIALEEKIYRILGRMIESLDAELGVLFVLEEDSKTVRKTYARKSLTDEWFAEPVFNKNIIEKAIISKSGEYLVDWEGVNSTEGIGETPKWQSVLVLPVMDHESVKGVIYLASPISKKELGSNEFSFLSTLEEVVKPLFY
ncbi:MAG: diguanylate cyclase [Clostridia bacterium]|nr:diguanylate cyclase [Clostridia bacterium]